MTFTHQYLDRDSLAVKTETFCGDRLVNVIYSSVRERSPALFSALTSPVASRLLGYFNYDLALATRIRGLRRFCTDAGIDLSDALEPVESLNTPRKIFERRIRYWDTRPMAEQPGAAVSPADSRVVVGSLDYVSRFFIKEKFFDFEELLSYDKTNWHSVFALGDFAVFRLTPDKYHYTHTPVAGKVADIYEIDGMCHSCNPGAAVTIVTPYSKNRRLVTIIDTDVPGGDGIGHVAMVEVAALMVGEIYQRYSGRRYDDPAALEAGMSVERGCPKSLFRPGSSVVVLFFQKHRTRFADDLARNTARTDVKSRFTADFQQPLVETDIRVRSLVAVSATDGGRVCDVG